MHLEQTPKYHRFPVSVINHAVRRYHRLNDSYRDIAEELAYRGIVVSHKTAWCIKFSIVRNIIKKLECQQKDKWYLDEMTIKINGEYFILRRAVDSAGHELDIFLQKCRNKKSATRFLTRLLGCYPSPRVAVTDKLRSYRKPIASMCPNTEYGSYKGLNTRAENAHQPVLSHLLSWCIDGIIMIRKIIEMPFHIVSKLLKHFKGFCSSAEVIMLFVYMECRFTLSYRELGEMACIREAAIDHSTLQRWIKRFVLLIDKQVRKRKKPIGSSWRMYETYIKLNGNWVYLYRAIDLFGSTIEFLLRKHRDKVAAKAFFRKAFKNNDRPDKVNIDKSGSNISALTVQRIIG